MAFDFTSTVGVRYPHSYKHITVKATEMRNSVNVLATGQLYNFNMTSVVSRNPNVMHGTPCFAGTRVAVRTLFDHLEAGYSIEQFLAEFPTVQRDQVITLLRDIKAEVEQSATAGPR